MLIPSSAFIALALVAPGDAAFPHNGATPDRASLVSTRGHVVSEFLGFALGEERRYGLGPQEALNPSEWASWSIRLQSVAGDPPIGMFLLTHERNDPALRSDDPHLPPIVYRPFPIPVPRGTGPAYRDPVHARLSGRMRLNAEGFPLELTFSGTQRFSNRVHEFHVAYRFEDDGYVKDVASNGRDWSLKVPIGAEIELDTDPLAGVHVYYPTTMPCLGRGSILHYLADHSALTPQCDTPVLLFANPGLLSIALSTAWTADEDARELWLLTPTGPLLRDPGIGSTKGGYSSSSANARDESHYYRRERFELIGQSKIDVGSRRLTAWEIDVEGAIEQVYLDDEGRVLRVDLGPHPITSLPRWIRLLWPDER